VNTPRPTPVPAPADSAEESRSNGATSAPVRRTPSPLPASAVPTQLIRVDERAELERALLSLLPRVRTWLYRLLGPRGPIDDATQDTLLELATAYRRFEGRSTLTTFAHRITVRVAYRYYGRAEASERRDPDAQPSSAPTPEAELAREQVLDKLHRCLAKLPPRRRTAFVLCSPRLPSVSSCW
jgi:RNA polymerase sigma factor (sigma-70 family)